LERAVTWLAGVLVDVSVQHGVLELFRRTGIGEDARRAVLDPGSPPNGSCSTV
jgi:hypothetical protein